MLKTEQFCHSARIFFVHSSLQVLSGTGSDVIVELASILMCTQRMEEPSKSFVGKLNKFTFFAFERRKKTVDSLESDTAKSVNKKRSAHSKC